MIQEKITYACPHCGSLNIIKNGRNPKGKQQYRCKDCEKSGVLNPSVAYPEEEKEQILAAYHERPSMRGIERMFGVARQTLAEWLKKAAEQERITDTLLPAQTDDQLELDEVWSFVLTRKNKRWLWTALCRRTRQIVAFVIGDRSEVTCRKLWKQIPEGYQRCCTFSDFWEAYQLVFPSETHRSVGKDSGQTNHIERWNNTLRQWNARYVRKTLSFSKSDFYHEIVTRLFIIKYNLSRLPQSFEI